MDENCITGPYFELELLCLKLEGQDHTLFLNIRVFFLFSELMGMLEYVYQQLLLHTLMARSMYLSVMTKSVFK